MKKATIIGSGISGLSIAKMLSGSFITKVLEKADKTGGLIKCERVNGNLFHKVGGHVFNSKNQSVLDWFWGNFDRDNEFILARRNAKILLGRKFIGYPIENHLYQLPEGQLTPIINELLEIITDGKKEISAYDNFKDFLIGNFGSKLYDLYFGPYNSKIWNTDISKVPLGWLDGKLPMPQINEVIISNIIKKEESAMVHSSFYYPKRDGSQYIIDRLSQKLDINLSYEVVNIKEEQGHLILNNGDFRTDILIYCGDVRRLASIIEIEDNDLKNALNSVINLPSNGTSNFLCETDDNDLSWLYLPEEKFKAHRIIYTGNFSSTNNEGSGRKTCVVEFSGKQDEASMVNELKLLPGNLVPLAFNYEPNSYIIQQKGTHDKIVGLKKLLGKFNIYLLGRFAEWEYYNMDKCIERAMELSSKLLNLNYKAI
jgi:protoporphyrinogen oxidase